MTQQTEKSRWQQEYDALPLWARNLVDALRSSCGYGSGPDTGSLKTAKVLFGDYSGVDAFHKAVSDAQQFAYALSAPWPPPAAPVREKRVLNVVELMAAAEAGDVDCAFDQACAFGHRVEGHAVYCHNEAWPDRPRKCHRNRSDFPHEDCPGFVSNPDFVSPKDQTQAL